MATPKQRKAFEKAVEDPTRPMGSVMREAGYTKESSENPKLLVDSKGWIQLLEENIPDTLLTDYALKGLVATKLDPSTGKKDIDYSIGHKYWHDLLKLKDKFPAIKSELTGRDGKDLFPIPIIDVSINDSHQKNLETHQED
ncbi:MAG: hypothetical protein ACYDBV_08640 [Nitrospiria bacterium]